MAVRRARRRLSIVALAAGAFVATAVPALAAPSPNGVAHGSRPVCGPPSPGTAHCHARVVTDAGGVKPLATSGPTGYSPQQLQSAYKLTAASSANGAGRTIAIVDAYDNPNAATDLATYRSQLGLPALNASGPSFNKVNQRGGSTPPQGNTSWGQEIALDVDMASAICPNCNILLVEADSNSFTNLAAAVNYAASVPGVVAISNSYGGSEFSSETSYEQPYNHPGIAVTVSSGDNGYGVEFPASSRYVTAVGGTSLKTASNTRGWSETAWSGAGSGCSAYITTKPVGQPSTGCSRRTVTDVSAVADPYTGVSVYDSYGSSNGNNWYVFGGTSVASPIIASVYALAGTGLSNATPYAHPSSLFDVTSGSNGRCTSRKSSSTALLCTAVTGYDGPTGMGTPNGTAAF